MPGQIKYWNRKENREETELVYGDRYMRWLYETGSGQKLTDRFLAHSFLSRVYGIYQSSPLSQKQVAPFIKNFKIQMSEYEPGPFKSFNDFFIRKFRPGLRSFIKEPHAMAAPAEARYLGFEKIDSQQNFPVKGEHLTASGILGSDEKAKPFVGGPLYIARLCPVDYHRYHYPDDGKTTDSYSVKGRLHSVNPVALKFKSDIFVTNERAVSLLETKNFGRLAYVEVGALCVGKIVQTHRVDAPFNRGDEKGYFLFGASTVIVMGEPGAWKIDSDILSQTSKNRETYLQLGEKIATVSK